MVYVLDVNGQPIMPTENHAKVRVLLKQGKAKVVRRCPFTIKLLYESTTYTQEVALGVDAGSREIGISATTKAKTLFEAKVILRNDITKLLSSRREYRRSRRHRKTRYRKPRFLNRRPKDKRKTPGKRDNKWFAPSIQNKADTHLTLIAKVHKILPVSRIRIEVAAFDIQKLKADIEGLKLPQGTDYQQGDQLGFWNVREYVLFRDGYKCQCCKGKSKDKILNVHHIESRMTGGNAPNNLITLCETCHQGYHNGKIKLPNTIKRGMKFKDAAFMGIMRWAVYDGLKKLYPDVSLTYGYITKNLRIKHKSPKDHHIDARCISGNPEAVSDGTVFLIKKVRCHNRQIHKLTINKGGTRKLNQSSYKVKGFRLFDKVKFMDKECFIFGRRTSGSFDIRTLDGTKISSCAGYKKLKLLEAQSSLLIERRMAVPPMTEAMGFPV